MVKLAASDQRLNRHYLTPELPLWITAKRYAELSGYSYNAIQAKCNQNMWTAGDIWTKAPDRHLMINWRAVDRWINPDIQSKPLGHVEALVVMLPEWVQATRYSQLSGYSYNAIRNKCYKGIWAEGKTWINAPDNHLMINWRSVDEWILNG